MIKAEGLRKNHNLTKRGRRACAAPLLDRFTLSYKLLLLWPDLKHELLYPILNFEYIRRLIGRHSILHVPFIE